MKNNLEIAKNIRSIENLKIKILGKVYSLLKAFNEDESGEVLVDNLCDILISAYLLGEKLGYDFEEIDEALQKNSNFKLLIKTLKENIIFLD
ncbi:MazG-like family protein [Thermoanaerobacter sp. RKWS2]|nr:MazG-like family protein [Thermoanaerobacter sp. RKWS2]